ncbi:Uncharacterised protein [Enterobacter cloacae]|nr:Uncharacterised protein [Enterobacter cloacae]
MEVECITITVTKIGLSIKCERLSFLQSKFPQNIYFMVLLVFFFRFNSSWVI